MSDVSGVKTTNGARQTIDGVLHLSAQVSDWGFENNLQNAIGDVSAVSLVTSPFSSGMAAKMPNGSGVVLNEAFVYEGGTITFEVDRRGQLAIGSISDGVFSGILLSVDIPNGQFYVDVFNDDGSRWREARNDVAVPSSSPKAIIKVRGDRVLEIYDMSGTKVGGDDFPTNHETGDMIGIGGKTPYYAGTDYPWGQTLVDNINNH
ncbi:hypothetical protein [Halogeometricum borinquense]|uniref:hypothetical protein n=1 Tax=Halogeometricum borinquense TaxID=60847 RepID=UPI003442E880